MSRNVTWVVPLLCLAAGPARALGFTSAGNWVAGGSTYFSYYHATDDAAEDPYTDLELEVSPELAWFFADGVALQLSPGISLSREDHWGEDQSSSWTVSLAIGPRWYIPVNDRLWVVTAFQFGFQEGETTYDKPEGKTVVKVVGPGAAGEAGLAFPVGTGGLFEVVARYSSWTLDRTVDGSDQVMAWDRTYSSLGLRYRIVL